MIFIYIIDELYCLPAYLSILSLIKSINGKNDNIEVKVCANNNLHRDLLNCFQMIDEKIKVSTYFELHPNPVVNNRLLRMDLVSKNCLDKFAFIVDADTIFTEKINSLFDKLIISNKEPNFVCGVTEYEKASNAFLYFSKDGIPNDINVENKKDIYENVFGKEWFNILMGIQFNNGFVGFLNCGATINKWRYYYEKGIQISYVNAADDQVPLAASMHSTNCNYISLPKCFNSMGIINGSYAMYHAWAGKWVNELKVILSFKRYYSDFGKQYYLHINDVPPLLIDSFKKTYGLISGPFRYLSIDSIFEFEKLYKNVVDRFLPCHPFSFIEIGGYSKGKGITYMYEICKNKFKKFDLFALHQLTPEEILDYHSNIEKLSISMSIVKKITDIKSNSFDFVFFEMNNYYDDLIDYLDYLKNKIRTNGFIAGFLGKSRFIEVKATLQKYCELNNLTINFQLKSFLISGY